MAMELQVFSDRRLKSTTDWQHQINTEGFPLRLAEHVSLPTVKGLVPANLGDEQIGFECYHDNAKATVEFLGSDNFSHAWRYALGFRWRGVFSELQAAWMAATAYAAATDGIIFDHEEGKALTPRQARDMVAQIIRDIPRAVAFLEELNKNSR